MSKLALMIMQPLISYVLGKLEDKYGDRIVQLEKQIEELLKIHQENSQKKIKK
jgi:hypothetical protein